MAAKKRATKKKSTARKEAVDEIASEQKAAQLRADVLVDQVSELLRKNRARIVTEHQPNEIRIMGIMPDGGIILRIPPCTWGVGLDPDAPDPGPLEA